MTENKRFYTTRHHHESGNYKMVHDKSERFSFPYATRDSDLFLHCMNTLADENEQLKCLIDDYKSRAECDKEIIEDLHKEFENIKKENEQLKQQKDKWKQYSLIVSNILRKTRENTKVI